MSETTEAPQVEASPEPEADASDDLRAAISAAIEEVSARDEAGEAERDERGRFVARDAGPEAPVDGAEPEAPPEAQAAPVEPAAPAIPPELEPVKAVLDEHKELYQARGIPPAEAVRALFGAQKALQERPYEAIQQLARDFGVDLTRFGQQQPITNDQAINTALQRLEALERAHTEQQQQAEASRMAEINRQIATFKSDPKHVHFPAVQKMMGALMTSEQADDLATAYDMACRAHPQVFQAIQKAEQEARDKAATVARSQAAAQAKAKAVSVRGSPAVNGFTKPPDTLRETIKAAMSGRLN